MFLHGLVIAIIIGASYWFVEAVQRRRSCNTFFRPPRRRRHPPPAAKKKASQTERRNPTNRTNQRVHAYRNTETLPTPEYVKEEDEGVDGGVEGVSRWCGGAFLAVF